jgi:hypothetical protein
MNHMIGSRMAFIDLDAHMRGTARFGDDLVVEIKGRGKAEFLYKNGEWRIFNEVLYIPKLSANIISVGRLDEDGYQVVIGNDELVIREPGGRLLAWVKRTVSQLYLLSVTLSAMATRCLVTRGEAEAWRWHEHLGHLNFSALKNMAREEFVQGLLCITAVEHPCEACMAGKQKRTSFPTQAQYQTDTVLELVHGDLCGKNSHPTLAGNNYFLLMVDDKSRYMSVVLLPSKDQASEAIWRF